MSVRTSYLLLAVLGLVLPGSQFIAWVVAHGIDVPLFFHDLFANRISGFFALDVIVSAVVVIRFVGVEGRRDRLTHLWAPVLGTLLVGVSFGLPLFLYLRERRIPAAPDDMTGTTSSRTVASGR